MGLHLAESQADTGCGDFFAFGESVKPVGLDFTGHDKKAPVFEFGGDELLCPGVFKVESSLGSETQAGDG